MAVLFRPWAQPSENIHQDSTISTTTATHISKGLKQVVCDDLPREVKYRNVKEHMKRRSEKRSRRTLLKSEAEKLNEKYEPSGEACVPYSPRFEPPIPPPFSFPLHFPSSSPKLYEPVERIFKDGWDDINLASPELLEVALSQGLPPSLVEEYARLLTEQQRQIAERTRKQRPKKFRCPHCQVGFSNNGQLKGHIRIHTGERPFKCDAENCGKSFTRNEELTRHRRIHSGLRPFPCPECGKRFGRKDHLKKHVRTHFQQRYQLVPIFHSQYPYLFGL